jgi:hypothetical protein
MMVQLGHSVTGRYKYGDLTLRVGGASNQTAKHRQDFCRTCTRESQRWRGPDAFVRVNIARGDTTLNYGRRSAGQSLLVSGPDFEAHYCLHTGMNISQSQGYLTADCQSASLSSYQAIIRDLRQIFPSIPWKIIPDICGFLLAGRGPCGTRSLRDAVPDERKGL